MNSFGYKIRNKYKISKSIFKKIEGLSFFLEISVIVSTFVL